jgi:hypothetical protein
MVRFRRSLLVIAIGSAMLSRGAVAQRGSFSSLTHTVTVTVPPRVRVQVASFSPTSTSAVSAESVSPSTQGLSLSVSATQAWVLSIGSNPASELNAKVRWSLESGSGFSKLTSSQVRIASGNIAGDRSPANVFFRNVVEASSAEERNQSGPPVVLTMSAP